MEVDRTVIARGYCIVEGGSIGCHTLIGGPCKRSNGRITAAFRPTYRKDTSGVGTSIIIPVPIIFLDAIDRRTRCGTIGRSGWAKHNNLRGHLAGPRSHGKGWGTARRIGESEIVAKVDI